jgi:hypothetical protein
MKVVALLPHTRDGRSGIHPRGGPPTLIRSAAKKEGARGGTTGSPALKLVVGRAPEHVA